MDRMLTAAQMERPDVSTAPRADAPAALVDVVELLEAVRMPAGIELPGEEAALARLRSRYGELSRQARATVAERLLVHAELRPLQQRFGSSLDLARLIYRELDRDRGLLAEPRGIVPAAALERLLSWYGDELQGITRQLALVQSTVARAEALFGLIQLLWKRGKAERGVVHDLARAIFDDCCGAENAADFWPTIGAGLARLISATIPSPDPAALVRGVTAARLLVWTAGQFREWDEQLEILSVAALLHDAGLCVKLAGGRGRLPAPHTERMLQGRQRAANRSGAGLRVRIDAGTSALGVEQNLAMHGDARHCGVGAALAAGILDGGSELPLLVAQHHERLDGSGGPHGLTGRTLSSGSRLLAAVCRLADAACESDNPSAPHAAARALYAEADAGRFDTRITLQLLATLCDASASRQPLPERDGRLVGFGAFGTQRLRRDEAHVATAPASNAASAPSPIWAGPNFLNRAPAAAPLSDAMP